MTAYKLLKNDALEEPRCVPQVPFWRAHVRHGLYDVVFDAKGLAQTFGHLANGTVVIQERRSCHKLSRSGIGATDRSEDALLNSPVLAGVRYVGLLGLRLASLRGFLQKHGRLCH
jgi:hypothetical protein